MSRPGEPRRPPGDAARLGGLCPRCEHARRITSARGSTFLLCRLAGADPRLARYPPQPVLVCARYRPAGLADGS